MRLASSTTSASSLEADQRRDGPERFLAKDLHLRRDAGQHRRLVERAAERMPLAAGRDLRALRFRVGDVLLDLGERVGIDQRALRDAGSVPGPTFSASTRSTSFAAKAS